MKKFRLLTLTIVLVLGFSTLVLASGDNDGIITWFLLGQDPPEHHPDINKGSNQVAQAVVRADAYIPCFIMIKLVGNYGRGGAISFGPDSRAILSHHTQPTMENYWMRFDNELGGFIDENWAPLGKGQNIEIYPGDDVDKIFSEDNPFDFSDDAKYLMAGEGFKVFVYSNDTYKYAVISDGLFPVDADTSSTLDLQMRTKHGDNPDWTTTYSFLNNGRINTIENPIPACAGRIYSHQFRVPAGWDKVHGKYKGRVIFRATTI